MKASDKKNNSLPQRENFSRGFTLIETLVAISILMIAVVVPLTIVAGALQSSYHASDEITAVYLAQDAMEYVRNIRDTNAIYVIQVKTPPLSWWLAGLDGCLEPHGCQVDTVNAQVTTVGASPSALIYTAANQYVQSGSGTTSRFTRVVNITPVAGNADEEKVTVTVTWTGSSVYKNASTFQVSEDLYNVWK